MHTITDEELEKVKKISIEMLDYFDSFCRQNGLTYFISCGTALGAVRHRGFIPWDDDVDVDMPIEDYNKLLKVWLKNGDKKKYFLQTKKTEPDLIYPFYRLRLNGTTWTDIDCDKYKIHWGIPIDIFPVWNAPKSNFFKKLQNRCHGYGDAASTYFLNHNISSKLIKLIFRYVTHFFYAMVNVISCLSKKSDECYSPNDIPPGSGQYFTPKNLRLPPIDMEFENLTLMGPRDADAYLTWKYGDYMTPPSETNRAGHTALIFDLDNDSSKYTGVIRRNK